MLFQETAYGLVYLMGFLLYAVLPSKFLSLAQKISIAVFAANGCILGGRLGYVSFYEPLYFLSHPYEIYQIWRGGMSYHGGVIGLVLALYLYSRITKSGPWFFFRTLDRACMIALVIIPLGRICNFYNGELWGRITSLPFGVIFEGADGFPRHPDQLYEAFAEGPMLYLIIICAKKYGLISFSGAIACVYLAGYSILRFFTEFFREPDKMVGYLWLKPEGTGLAVDIFVDDIIGVFGVFVFVPYYHTCLLVNRKAIIS